MKININDKIFEVQNKITIHGLIKELKLDTSSTAVAVNKVIISRKKYNDLTLEESDKVDLVTIAPGG